MKKLIIMLASILIPVMSMGQAQINTKKTKIADFTQKITKVVLTGNVFYDTALQEEITLRWRISPFEFCTLEEFDRIRSDGNHYFLMTATGQFRKETEPGLTFLTLVKGGSDADKGIDKMLEVVSFPFASAEDPSGREFVFLPAIIDIIQQYVYDSMDNDFNAYVGLANYTMDLPETCGMKIVFSEDDMNSQVDKFTKDLYFDDLMSVAGEDETDACLTENAENTLVSYVVVPHDAKPGSFCYKMLIGTRDYRLYYFKRHRISARNGKGFLIEDIRRISINRASK